MKNPMTGGCLCGAVRYELVDKPLRSGFCHCRDCQRVTGSGHAAFMVLKRESLQIDGATSAYESGNNRGGTTIRHFCPTCGSRLFAEFGAPPKKYSLYAGTLDDPNRFVPDVAIYVGRRTNWDRTAMDLTEYEEDMLRSGVSGQSK